MLNEDQKIFPVNIEEQMKTAYIDYSMSVIVGRALPDVRDGFKPVHRRILFAMHELGIRASASYKKSARIVGEVLGKYHPHGDTAVYDAMVRMAQVWSMRATLIDGQGNYGSPDGDGPAAMRYTEAKLTKLAEAVLQDIDKETVDFQLNFDDSLKEPTILPTRIPQLLVNGSSGIAVGMATNMMPHNLGEVIDGCIGYIDNRDITIDELMRFVKAPDFPTGGIIYGIEGIKQAMHTGRGRVIIRGKVEVENVENTVNERPRIIINEVPYQVSRDALTLRIGTLVNDKIIEGISDVANQSNKEGTRIVVELKRDAVPEVIVNQLYRYTDLQVALGVNNVVLVRGRPRLLNLKELIGEFVRFRHEIVVKRTEYELREAEKKAHILQGYLIALGHLDAVIKLIRESTNPELAKQELMEHFSLSDIQAKAILELRLQRLTGMERQKIKDEYDSVMKSIAYYKEILSDEPFRYKIIKEELIEVKEKYATERRSEIQYAAGNFDIRDVIPNEDVVITISHSGYIKRTSTDEYRQQKRGGKGMRGSVTANEDWIEHLFIASTHHTLLFFTEKGRCHWLKVYEIPESDKGTKGRAIQNILQIAADDNIRAIIDIANLGDKDFVSRHYILLCTKNGIVKKTLLEDFSRPRVNGIMAINILENDRLLEARLTDGKSEIMLAIKGGNAIRFNEERVRVTGRGATGVTGMDIPANDEVIGMVIINTQVVDTQKTVLVVSESGFGKRTPVEAYRITNRGGKGVKTINITRKTGKLVAILDVQETDDLMITCKSGITIRTAVASIRESGRNSQGVRLIDLKDGDQIAAIAKIPVSSEDETKDISEVE